MKILILYFLIIIATLQATTPVITNRFIKPVVNLNEFYKENQEAFIAFEGTPGQYKTAGLYITNQNNEPEKKQDFVFNLPENKMSTFFSAHTGSFTSPTSKDLVLLVKDPTIGTKVYVWTIKPEGFKRLYEEPYIINPNQPLSQPIQSIQTTQENGQDQLTISFGSPNRNIVVLNFKKETINQQPNIAEGFLQNQAGTIFIVSNSINKDVIVFNAGEPTQSQSITNNTTKNYNTKETINQVFYENAQNPIFLMNFNKLYFTETATTAQLNPQYKHKQIILQNSSQVTLLDFQGNILTYEIKEDKQQASLAHNQPTPFNTKTKIKHIEFFENKENQYFTAQTNTKNYFYINSKIKAAENQKNNPETSTQDTIIFTTKKRQFVPIKLNEKYEFLELTVEEQPTNAEVSLEEMAFSWEPTTDNIGYNVLKYNILYNVGSNIIKKKEKEGQTTLNKEVETQKHTTTHNIYVNAPPTILTEQTEHKVQLGHTLKIPLLIQDSNTDQKHTLTYLPKLSGATLEKERFIWKPTPNQQGQHNITFTVNDGHLESSTTNSVFVDTLKKTTTSTQKHNLTTNKEFILDLSTPNTKEYIQIEGPENAWISSKGIFHWIPLTTQLGNNTIKVERKGENKTENHIIETFVNSPPIISYRPDKTEYINYLEAFNFALKSFDANANQELYWRLSSSPEKMVLSRNTELQWQADKLDYNFYTVEITDSINYDIFNGTIYVNDLPKIISTPQPFIQQGENFSYEIIVEDKNQHSPNNQKENNTILYSMKQSPEGMMLENNRIIWEPTTEAVGEHKIIIEASDGLSTTEQSFVLNVNDIPTISSPDSIKIMVGDTLNHRIAASDQNQKTELAYSIRTTISEMYLNANTGQITWIPTPDDIGEHIVEVAVSDGFDKGIKAQEITVFVSGYPNFITVPPTEAYVNFDYIYYVSAQDAEKNKTPNEDIFVELLNSTLSNTNFDSQNYILSTAPTLQDVGKQTITLKLSDKDENSIINTFEILVLESSPCEPEEKESPPTNQTQNKGNKKMKRIYKILIGVFGSAIITEQTQ